MSAVEAEHFSLRWNNFHSNLATGFHALLEEVDLVDVTIAAEGQFVQAHKIVLSVSSPYFKELFKVNPCKHPIVILKDVCHKELVAILQFMYQGEVNVRQEELGAFLKTAELLQIKGLTGNEPPSEDVPPTPRMRMKPDPPISSEENAPRAYKRQRTEMPVQSAMRTPPNTSSRVMSPAPHPAPPPVTTQPPTPAQPPAPVQAPVPPPASAAAPNPVSVPKVAPPSPETIAEESLPFDMRDEHRPKEEPADYESDIEEIECKVVQSSSSLNQLLHGESSMLSQGSPQNSSNLFASLTGISQDSGSSQDGAQGVKWKYGGFDNNNISCPYCHRQFGYRGNLTIHIRDVHSHQGPHICPHCGKKMKNKSSLRTHLYRQHNKDLTEPSSCKKNETTSNELI
ncbi:protein bric-a-brac 1-like isoform X1 [Schistocerca americana]|uniref:protein bric-a-brac 1-like isoform X1 n=1 Tax=Schistocerca americana TaxID=7009 RepID=UPI001F4F1D69|nr:protein bric-a-brac 1-like isoform X1 [Schistocerca americana]XP_046995619.1 protein bric-a-brac 1-like isoform X1 [Schistocerca americana]XP_049780868.1 protein bric-a-brac 1-like isoform X2 [Schistocerca cancellata]XP_049863494.1 protein bric-a-brac 1-like isoform X3 [Schistocerca gregaria]XP_049959665.1 protein bric-a-brac 1-like isoform X1 [Schistocerca serialis cubense]